jgi:hypothetical protein
VKTADYVFLAPDNGVLTLALAKQPAQEIRAIENERLFNRPVSRTFHGRDIFAPVAAHLARGVAFGQVGPELTAMEKLPQSEPVARGARIEGRVLFADRFGNLITNITAAHLRQLPGEPRAFRLVRARASIRHFGRFYAEAAPGKAIALIGSSNHVELCVNGGSAQAKFRARIGDAVTVSC